MVDSGIDSGLDKYSALSSSASSEFTWVQRHAESDDDDATRLKDMDFQGDVSHLIPCTGNTATVAPQSGQSFRPLSGGSQQHRRRSSAAETTTSAASAVLSSCKAMQRKLEMKVDRTRNILTQPRHLRPASNEDSKTASNSIMPIARMRIPGQPDCRPLVDYGDDGNGPSNGEDDDDEVEFYPIRKSANTKHELSDTFSLHEMTIVGTDDDDDDTTNVDTRTGVIFDEDDDDEDDSQTLEFLSPKPTTGQGFKDRCSQLFCCSKKLRL